MPNCCGRCVRGRSDCSCLRTSRPTRPDSNWLHGRKLAQPLRATPWATCAGYFEQRRLVDGGRPSHDPARFETLRRSFAAQRYLALHRSWQAEGTALIYGATSPVLGDAMAVNDGRVTRQLLLHSYLHLTRLVGSA